MQKVVEDDEQLAKIVQGLGQIEAILCAEQKRRVESNNITQEYIHQFLDKLELSLQQRVTGQFSQIDTRIKQVNETLSRVESRFD